MEHFPPLDSKSLEISKAPNIIARNAMTLATPVNELKFYRHISDLIGNNYSPQAKNLNIKSIGDSSSRNLSKT